MYSLFLSLFNQQQRTKQEKPARDRARPTPSSQAAELYRQGRLGGQPATVCASAQSTSDQNHTGFFHAAVGIKTDFLPSYVTRAGWRSTRRSWSLLENFICL